MLSLCSTADRCTLTALGVRFRQLRQFEVVGREQGKTAAGLDQVARDRPGQRQAVEGRGAASDFIHQHQRTCRWRRSGWSPIPSSRP